MRISGMTSLKLVYVENTQVTDDGVKMLQESLPNCAIMW